MQDGGVDIPDSAAYSWVFTQNSRGRASKLRNPDACHESWTEPTNFYQLPLASSKQYRRSID